MIASVCAHTICDLNVNILEMLLWAVELVILHSFYRRIKKETPDHYLMLIEVKQEGPLSYYVKYIGFRFIPMFLFCLINYKILSPFSDSGEMNVFIFNLVLVFGELLITNLRGARKYWHTDSNLGYQHLLMSFFLIWIPLLTYFLYPILLPLLPTTQGVIDSIWSALIIYSLYSAILFVSRKNNQEEKRYPEKEELLSFVSKFEKFIEEQSLIYNANADLVKSVAIYESLQRPNLIRLFERIFVFFLKTPTSQGIMQFTADYVISDEESIILAIQKYFKDTASDPENYDLFRKTLLQYNPREQYVTEIQRLYWTISTRGFDFSRFVPD